jgi:hypothetical protein
MIGRPCPCIVLAMLAAGLIAADATEQPAARPAAESGPVLDPGDVVLVAGDSLAAGLAAPLRTELHFVYRFGAASRNGSTAGYWRAALAAELARVRPSVVLLSLGTNDALSASARKTFAENLRALREACAAARARVVFIEPPSMPFDLSVIRDAIRQSGALWVEAPAVLERAPDDIHLTPKSYAAWAAHIRKALT